jgi:hypothetical protein
MWPTLDEGAREIFEEHFLRRAYEEHPGTIAAMARTTIHNRLEQLGIGSEE